MKTRKFLLLPLLLVVALSCKKQNDVIPSDSQAGPSISKAGSNKLIGNLPLADGFYYIQAMSHPELHLVLDVPDSRMDDGAIIQQFPYHGGANQLWYVYNRGGGYYSIRNWNSQKVLDVPNGSTASGEKIQQFTYHGGPNQLWAIVTNPTTGISRVYNKNSGLVLDIPFCSVNSGAQLQQHAPNNGACQAWYFLPLITQAKQLQTTP
jgi:hypothetical protein